MFQLSFLNTGLLILAAATVLPLIIWLLAKKRPPQVIFSTLRFIKKTEKEQKNRTQLRNILLLIIRMLIILLVVLAAGRPSLQIKGMKPGMTHPPTAVAIILDTSYSMDYSDNGKSSLEQAKAAVLLINKKLTPQDMSVLITSDSDWNSLNAHLHNGVMPNDLIASVRSTWLPLTMDKVIEYATEKLKSSQFSNREIYLLSDGQAQSLHPKPEIPVRVIPIKKTASFDNVAVTKAEPLLQLTSKQQTQLISFDIVNYGNSVRRDVLVRLDFNGVKAAEKFVTLQPFQKLTDVLPVQIMNSGWQSGYVEVLDERLTADNRCWYAFRYDLHPNIAVITQETSLPIVLQTSLAVFATAQGSVKLIQPQQVNWQQLKDYSVITIYKAGDFTPRLREFFTACEQSRKGVLYIADKDMKADWKTWYAQQFGLQFRQFEIKAVPLTYANPYHAVTSLLDMRQVKRISISDYWSSAASGSSAILLAAGNSALALAGKNSLLWVFDPSALNSRFYLDSAYPVFAFRSLQFLNNSRFETEQNIVGKNLSADTIIRPNGEKTNLYGTPFRTNEPGVYTLNWRGSDNEVIAIQPDFKESSFKPLTLQTGYKMMGERWQSELFLSRLGHDIWKYLLLTALLLFLLELVLVKTGEWRQGSSVN